MRNPGHQIIFFLAVAFLFFMIGLNSGCKGKEGKEEAMAAMEKAPDIKERLARLAPTEITYDESYLNEEQKEVLEKLVEAAKHMDKIFWKQANQII